MANEYVLDAHALVWFLEGNPRLEANARAAMQDPGSVLVPPDRAILALSLSLTPISEMHNRQIVATTLDLAAKTASPVSLLSCDRDIIASGLAPMIW